MSDDTRAASAVVALPYEQSPVFPLGVAGIWLVLIVAIGAEVVLGGPTTTRDVVGALVVVLVLGGLTGLFLLPPAMKRLRVGEEGLHVRGRVALPARHIGDVQVVRGRDASTTSWPGSRGRGVNLPSRQNLYGGLVGTGNAVGVVDERDRQQPSLWLLPSREPEMLAAALRRARDGS